MALNAKQTRFAAEYTIDHNATQAAIRAGYSPKSAYSQGQRLLKHAEISETIHHTEQTTAQKLQLTHEYVLHGLMEIAENGRTESARVRSLELLGKHQGMFTDRMEVEVEHRTNTELDREIQARIQEWERQLTSD
jgi:phage terminase small subunit